MSLSLPALYAPSEGTGEPVPTGAPTCQIKGIESATEGVWNGYPITREDMRAMADNFERFSSGAHPFYRPFATVNHDDELNCGIVTGARFDGARLYLDLDNMPALVGQWWNADRLHAPSIEFWEPGEFMQPDGQYNSSPVIRCLALLGNQAPGMKGMKSKTAVATFADSPPNPKGPAGMNREGLIAALAAAGFDQTKLNDLDTLLQYLVDCKAMPGAPADATAADPMAVPDLGAAPPMADVLGGGTPAATGSDTGGGAAGSGVSSVTVKFSDAAGKPGTMVLDRAQLAAVMGPEFEAMRRASAVAVTALRQQAEAGKRTAIQAFADRLAKANVPPVMIRAQCAVVAALDNVTVRKFADGRRGVGTQLAEALHILEGAAVPHEPNRFQEKIKQGDGTTATATSGNGPDKDKARADWDARKKAMFAADPAFRAKAKK